MSGDTGNRSRKFFAGVALASALVTSFGAIPSLEAMLTFPPTLAANGGLCDKASNRPSGYQASKQASDVMDWYVGIKCKIKREQGTSLKLSILGFVF